MSDELTYEQWKDNHDRVWRPAFIKEILSQDAKGVLKHKAFVDKWLEPTKREKS